MATVPGTTETTLPRAGKLRLEVRSAEEVGEVPLWAGGWELAASAARGLQQGGLRAQAQAVRLLGSGLLWPRLWSGVLWGVPTLVPHWPTLQGETLLPAMPHQRPLLTTLSIVLILKEKCVESSPLSQSRH